MFLRISLLLSCRFNDIFVGYLWCAVSTIPLTNEPFVTLKNSSEPTLKYLKYPCLTDPVAFQNSPVIKKIYF